MNPTKTGGELKCPGRLAVSDPPSVLKRVICCNFPSIECDGWVSGCKYVVISWLKQCHTTSSKNHIFTVVSTLAYCKCVWNVKYRAYIYIFAFDHS